MIFQPSSTSNLPLGWVKFARNFKLKLVSKGAFIKILGLLLGKHDYGLNLPLHGIF